MTLCSYLCEAFGQPQLLKQNENTSLNLLTQNTKQAHTVVAALTVEDVHFDRRVVPVARPTHVVAVVRQPRRRDLEEADQH